MNNIFLGNDPLLASATYDNRLAELQQMQQALEQQKQQLMQRPQENVSQSPVWDEIERLTAELTDKEFAFISEHEEFVKSQNKIAEALQAEYMRMMRPIVERNNRPMLDNHLVLLKRLRKEANKEIDKNMELLNEYVAKHSDISFAEFLKTKRHD